MQKEQDELKKAIKKEISRGASNTNHAIMIQMLKDSLEDGDFDNSACDYVRNKYKIRA